MFFEKKKKKIKKNFLFSVTSVEGGKEALLKLKEQTTNNFGIILVDCMMPGMDGFELLRIFKQAYSYEIPCISKSF